MVDFRILLLASALVASSSKKTLSAATGCKAEAGVVNSPCNMSEYKSRSQWCNKHHGATWSADEGYCYLSNSTKARHFCYNGGCEFFEQSESRGARDDLQELQEDAKLTKRPRSLVVDREEEGNTSGHGHGKSEKGRPLSLEIMLDKKRLQERQDGVHGSDQEDPWHLHW